MTAIEITDPRDPRVAPFVSLTEAQLRQGPEAVGGEAVFIAESPKVIHVALDAGLVPLALLAEERHLCGDAAPVLERCPADMPVYTGSRQVLEAITGYRLTRGVLCAMRRPVLPSVADICNGEAARVAVVDGVCDTTNIGSIFRAAAAMGIDGVLLTPTSCDPLNRRSVRVSMGNVFLVPWTWLDAPVESLGQYGFHTVALALTDKSVSIDDPQLKAEPRLALVLGTEGDGLAPEVIAATDYTARIPMHNGVDSLNVASAAAVAFWELRRRPGVKGQA
ncbi:MAG: RNA methyltransferase [Bacteroidales bacterium]|nr:RNA methyltransferase [Bacteroidales bacterium]